MALPVYIFDVVDEIDQQNEMITGFINRKTGELAILTVDDYSALEHLDDGGALDKLPPWQQEIVPKLREISESEDFTALPSPYGIDDYRIIEEFVRSIKDDTLGGIMDELIQGRGAFRRFRDAVHRYRLGDQWWDFKKNALKIIAIEFLEEEGIPWTDVKPEGHVGPYG